MRAREEGLAERGLALVSVLGLLVLLTMVALAFVSLMNAEQRLAGGAYRNTAALYLAEAGVEKALWHLANRAPDGSRDGSWRPVGYQEELGAGSFVIEEIKEEPAGVLAITVRGEVGGAVRRIRRIARIAPRALTYGLFSGDVVLARQSRTYVVPSLKMEEACQRFGDIAVSREFWFDKDVVLNSLDGQKVHDPLPDLVLVGEARLILGNKEWLLNDVDALRREVPGAYVGTLRNEEVSMPSVDLEAYRALAKENTSNVDINHTVGERTLDRVMSEKKDSLYTAEQFERILAHLDRQRREGKELRLAGVVFVEGAVSVGRALLIDEGALIVRGSIRVMDRARLEVRHGPQTSTLPGVIAYGDGGMIRLGKEATVNVDGLLFAGAGLEVIKASVDVRGAILAGQGILNQDGLVVVRYQPSVLRTIGLSRTAHVLLRPLTWQELP